MPGRLSPTGFAVNVRVAGVVPLAGAMESQFPPVQVPSVTVNATGAPLLVSVIESGPVAGIFWTGSKKAQQLPETPICALEVTTNVTVVVVGSVVNELSAAGKMGVTEIVAV